MSPARFIGTAIQAIVLGALLFLAIMKLIAMHSGAAIFQYQGF